MSPKCFNIAATASTSRAHRGCFLPLSSAEHLSFSHFCLFEFCIQSFLPAQLLHPGTLSSPLHSIHFTHFTSLSAETMPASNYPRPPQRDSWFAPLSIDLFVKVLKVTFLHPFVCWMIPLCFRAQTVRWEAPRMIGSIAWASFITLVWMAGVVNQRVAHGLPREVDLSEEVIVITGGASGLGMLVAEVYGMRGATVAVLDVNDMENGEARGVTYYKCDVGDKNQIAKVAAEIEKDVSWRDYAKNTRTPEHSNIGNGC